MNVGIRFAEVRHPYRLIGTFGRYAEARDYYYCYVCGNGVKDKLYCDRCGSRLMWLFHNHHPRVFVKVVV